MTSATTTIQADEDRAVRAVFDAVSKAWTDGDADAFTDSFTDSATAVLPGFYLPGKDAIRAAMAQAFAGTLRNSTRIHEVQGIRLLGESTAIVITNSATALPGEAEPPAQHRDRATWVLTKHDATWLVEAYHGCPQDAA